MLLLLLLNSCTFDTFYFSSINKHYHCTLVDDFNSRNINKIAVYAFSKGYSDGTWSLNTSYVHFPEKITSDLELIPSSETKGPSVELSTQCADYISNRGFKAKEVTDLDHTKPIMVSSVVQHAKDLGYDAAFIVYYKAYYAWYLYDKDINLTRGFLFIPNAALIDTKDNTILWSSQHYGLVQNSHFFNLTGSQYNYLISEAVVEYASSEYVTAAKKTVNMIFEPNYFKKSQIPFPGVTTKKLKL